MKRALKVFFAFLLIFLFLNTQLLVQAELSLWPGKLDVNMKSFPTRPVTYKQIQIKNLKNSSALVKTQIIRPSDTNYMEGYSSIPNLSWVSISPEEMSIPANGEGFFDLTIDVPKENQSFCYNQSWEVRVLFYEPPSSGDGKVSVVTKLASRIFIHTPKKTAEQQIQINPFVLLWFFGVLGLAVIIVMLYSRRRYSINRQKAAMFYVRDKQHKHHKRN